jgi:hypothetical protein
MILSLFPASWTTPTHATTTPAPVFAPARHGRILCTAGTAAASPLAAGAAPVVAAYWDEVCVAQQASSSRRAVLQPTAVDDADLVLEYLTSCGQLCAEEGCEVVAAFVDGAPSAADDGAERAISLQIDRCDAGGPTLVEGVVAPTDAAAVAAAAADSVLTQKDERTRALESCMDWFTATLIAMDGPTEEQEEENFVLLGRSVLHTKAAEVSFAPTLQEMHRDCWRMVADAPCAAPPQLARVAWRAIPGAIPGARNSPNPPIPLGRYLANGEGGGALFLAPRFTNYEAFDDFSLLLRAGLRGLVSPDLVVQARARFGARAHARPHPRATPRNSPTAASVAPQAYHPLHGSKSRRSPSPTIHIFRDSEDLLADGRGMETINFD